LNEIQREFSLFLSDIIEKSASNPQPPQPMTPERERKIRQIIEMLDRLGLVKHENGENRKGDAAPTKEQSTANS
jgi:hypothetical protein